jgi:hypothetical protein
LRARAGPLSLRRYQYLRHIDGKRNDQRFEYDRLEWFEPYQRLQFR